MSSKRCFKCLMELPLECFYRHKQMADGRLITAEKETAAAIKEAILALIKDQ